MTKAYYGFIIVLVAGAVFVHVGVVFSVQVVAWGIGLGAELHHAEGYCGAREDMWPICCVPMIGCT